MSNRESEIAPKGDAVLPCPFCGSSDVGERQVTTYSVDSSYTMFGFNSCCAGFEEGTADDWNNRIALAAAEQPAVDVEATDLGSVMDYAFSPTDVQQGGSAFRLDRVYAGLMAAWEAAGSSREEGSHAADLRRWADDVQYASRWIDRVIADEGKPVIAQPSPSVSDGEASFEQRARELAATLPLPHEGAVMAPERNGDYQRGYDAEDMRDFAEAAIAAALSQQENTKPAVPEAREVPKEHEPDDDCNCQWRGEALGWNACRDAMLAAAAAAAPTDGGSNG